jgi:hypothetical protein
MLFVVRLAPDYSEKMLFLHRLSFTQNKVLAYACIFSQVQMLFRMFFKVSKQNQGSGWRNRNV